MLSSDGQANSVLEEILGEKKRKWFQKYKCLCCWYIKK
jgi:hypothetical protein